MSKKYLFRLAPLLRRLRFSHAARAHARQAAPSFRQASVWPATSRMVMA